MHYILSNPCIAVTELSPLGHAYTSIYMLSVSSRPNEAPEHLSGSIGQQAKGGSRPL